MCTQLRFTYEEELHPEEFFVPYVWQLVVSSRYMNQTSMWFRFLFLKLSLGHLSIDGWTLLVLLSGITWDMDTITLFPSRPTLEVCGFSYPLFIQKIIYWLTEHVICMILNRLIGQKASMIRALKCQLLREQKYKLCLQVTTILMKRPRYSMQWFTNNSWTVPRGS